MTERKRREIEKGVLQTEFDKLAGVYCALKYEDLMSVYNMHKTFLSYLGIDLDEDALWVMSVCQIIVCLYFEIAMLKQFNIL